MNGSTRARLSRLESVWSLCPEPSPDPVAFVAWWSTPTLPGELWHVAKMRAWRRHIAETGNRQAFLYRLTDEERRQRTEREIDDLSELQAKHGVEEGAWRWDAIAQDWPPGTYGRGDAQSDTETLWDRLRHHWGVADGYRGSSPLFRKTWPEWRPDLDDAGHVAFDDLLDRERERRCAALTTA